FLSFALHDPTRLESMLVGAGFREVRVERTTREDSFESFADYWQPIEAGVGSIPQAYLRLADADRRAVREEVRSRLSRFELNGKMRMSVEMLIGSGRAEADIARPRAPNLGERARTRSGLRADRFRPSP